MQEKNTATHQIVVVWVDVKQKLGPIWPEFVSLAKKYTRKGLAQQLADKPTAASGATSIQLVPPLLLQCNICDDGKKHTRKGLADHMRIHAAKTNQCEHPDCAQSAAVYNARSLADHMRTQ